MAFTAPFKVAVELLTFDAKFDEAEAFMVGTVLSTKESTYEIRNEVLEFASREGILMAKYIPLSPKVAPKLPRYEPEVALASPASQTSFGSVVVNPLLLRTTLARESVDRSPSSEPFDHSALTNALLSCPTTVFVELYVSGAVALSGSTPRP